jgi:hypothetical protein
MPLIRGFHTFDDHFTQIPNHWLRDTRLSLKAIGLLAQIMSHSPGWNMSIRALAKANGTGMDTIKSAVLELEKSGYLVRSVDQKKNADGTFADYDFVTQDPFQNPVTGKPRHGETGHKEEQDTKEEKVNKNNERTHAQIEKLFDEFWNSYPRKLDKAKAFRAFKSALKRTKFEDIIAGVIAYRNDPKRDPDYTKYPATWLNNDAWENAAAVPEVYVSQRREREIAVAQQTLKEIKEQEAKAAPPPKCEHGKTTALCKICIRN